MRLPRPRSLNNLILVGFGLVGLPLLVAVIWALINLDRLAAQSERLISTGVQAAENNRLLQEHLTRLERVSRQFQVLGNADSLELAKEDLITIDAHLKSMSPLTELANATALAASIGAGARRIVYTLEQDNIDEDDKVRAIAEFALLRERTVQLTSTLSLYVDTELRSLQESTRRAQRVSAWQVAALVPGTILLVIFFIVLVARPIRQIDEAIHQLGQSGFSKPITVKGPTDLERLGRQLEWLRMRLLELAQEKNKFLRHMSHELKTPLANIREGTELLLDGTLGNLDKPQREVTDILRMNGLKLQQLIENLLSFSAWQTKTEVLTLSDFPVRELVVSVAKAQRLTLKAAHIQLKLEVDNIIVNADREKIRTVLDNLLSNAIKFTPRGGLITIRAYGTRTGVVLEFGDTGPGIPREESPRIFEAFFQGTTEQGGQVAGTGIGLSVVMECIQAHDGSVELVDSGEFSGAHFRVTIPQRNVQQHKLAANA
ncbi:MAG: histidine kinase [Woeseiaceae bacterium]|nr:histidine kinase [Woeseiaceae bacterium]NIP19813.1 histidine kinase [Woeseiaceae bacterium]NIS89930.1 histidine kinase [Woeseiaceae bacterium]